MAKILIIEDNVELLKTLAFQLEDSDHHVFCSSTAEFALSILRQLPIEMVITDIKLKGLLSGLDIIEELNNSQTKILAISKCRQSLKKAENLKVPTLSKPFNQEKFLSIVNILLEC